MPPVLCPKDFAARANVVVFVKGYLLKQLDNRPRQQGSKIDAAQETIEHKKARQCLSIGSSPEALEPKQS